MSYRLEKMVMRQRFVTSLYLGFNLVLLTLLGPSVACPNKVTASGSFPIGSDGVDTLQLLATYTNVQYGWQQVQLWNDPNPNWPTDQYVPDGRDDQTGQRETFFGAPTPPGSSFLLYFAPGWNTPIYPTPVLLVMGANDNVDREYADPNLDGSGTCGSLTCPTTGLMQYLSGLGYSVFAVDFANMQGDNYEWAQTIGDAIAVIKWLVGAPQVDLIGWSKGAFASRIYVSSVYPSWGRPYQNDVQKLILLGNPNGGLDYTFAHGIQPDPLIYPQCGGSLNGPSPHTEFVCYGTWYSEPDLSIYSNYFTGQRQMLARWDYVYGVDETQTDWYTTYYGGQGYVSYSLGIQYAIDNGSLIQTILNAGIPASVETFLLCGADPDIPYFYNENRGISDGVVFVASCTETTGIGNVAAVVTIASDNHLQLGWDPSAEQTIAQWLSD